MSSITRRISAWALVRPSLRRAAPSLRGAAVLLLVLLSLGACGTRTTYQGMTADQIYRLAQQEYAEGDYDNAVKALDRLFLSFAGFEESAAARFLLASAYYNKGDYLSARSEYLRFVDRYPSHPKAPDAALGVCKSLAALSPIPQRDQKYTNDALVVCRNVVVDYAGSPQSVEAAEIANRMRLKLAEKEFLNAEFYFRRKLYDSAIIYYRFVADLYSETPFAPKALLGIYRSNMAIGYDDLAEDALKELKERYPESPEAREVNTDGEKDAGGGV